MTPHTLAAHLAISVINLSSLRHDAPGVAYLLDVEPEAFSAVTVFRGTERTVVYNDGHSPARQSSDVSHELAHGLLRHQPVPALAALLTHMTGLSWDSMTRARRNLGATGT